MTDFKKYLYRNPISGVYTGFWACMRPRGPYTGLWPEGLLERVWQLIGRPKTIFQSFAGLSKVGVGCDWNRNVRPDIVADSQHLPVKPNSFDCVLMDPPYSETYVQHYSRLDQRIKATKPPFSFYKAMAEAARVVKPGGHLIILHTLIPLHPNRQDFRRVAVIGVSTGPNKRIRCLSIFQRFTTIQATLTNVNTSLSQHAETNNSN